MLFKIAASGRRSPAAACSVQCLRVVRRRPVELARYLVREAQRHQKGEFVRSIFQIVSDGQRFGVVGRSFVIPRQGIVRVGPCRKRDALTCPVVHLSQQGEGPGIVFDGQLLLSKERSRVAGAQVDAGLENRRAERSSLGERLLIIPKRFDVLLALPVEHGEVDQGARLAVDVARLTVEISRSFEVFKGLSGFTGLRAGLGRGQRLVALGFQRSVDGR